MKRKFTLALFAAVFMSLASFGQHRDSYAVIQNGDKSNLQQEELLLFNTGTMFDYNSAIPICGNKVNLLSKSQFIVPQEQLDILSYAEITQLTFWATGARNWGDAEFEVYVKEVYYQEFTNLDFYDWDNMTLVYSGSLFASSNGKMDIPFADNYLYEGGDLLIGIKQIVPGSPIYCTWKGITTSYHSALGGFGLADCSFYNKLPMMTIAYTPHEGPLCERPQNVVVNETYSTSAVINWMFSEGQTAWQIVYSTLSTFNPDEITPIDVFECPYTLTGLSPETQYYAYVRSICGEGIYSDWSNEFTFTTRESCATPYNLQFLGEEGHSALISWISQSDTHTLRYKKDGNLPGEVLLFCDFETTLPSGWILLDNDNDGFNWARDNNGYTSFEGQGCMYSLSYDHTGQNGYFLSPDNWMITPSVTLGGCVTFFAKGKKVGEGVAQEHFAVYVSTTDTNIESFTQVSPEYITTSDYALYSVDLSNYQGMGYIAIRHFGASHMLSLSIDNFTVFSEPSVWTEIKNVASSPYIMEGLSEHSFYEVQTKAVCSDEESSQWSESVLFKTTIECGNVVVNLAHPFFENFESSVFPPSCWTADSNPAGYSWAHFVLDRSYQEYGHQGNHSGSSSAFSGYFNTVEMVMPEMMIVGEHASLSFWSYNKYPEQSGSNSVWISTDGGNNYVRIWLQTSFNSSWVKTTVSLDAYTNQNILIAFRYDAGTSIGHGWYLDDVEIKVSCDKEFVTSGNWNVASNWSPAGVPTIAQSVLISAAATIPNGCVANANVISIGTNGSLTITEGGQLVHNNADVEALVKKTIAGYGVSDNGWYLIASPVEGNKMPSQIGNLVANEPEAFDLYGFNQSESREEWQNYKTGAFDYLENTNGYLYANAETVNLEFEGELVPSGTPVAVALDYDSSPVMSGWNLVGNPFPCNAYFEDDVEFYRMNEEGSELILSNGVINPCEGVFVKATSSGQSVSFTKTAPSTGGGRLSFNLYNNGKTINRARVHFGGSRNTEVFAIRPSSTKLFFSKEGKDFAAVGSESSGELPLNFKASENGMYTITVNCEEKMSYVHLIDNLTGTDTDLLTTSSYTFESKVTDYASRFKVVFVAQSDDADYFAFVNNGQLVVLNPDHESILQVIDMMGHVVLCGDAVSSLSMEGIASGVYVVRLTKGGEVKTQKIVVGAY